MGWRESFKHAFAVDKPEDLEPTEQQREIVDQLCRTIARRGMTTPVAILLETGQPYNYVASQFMHFFRPSVSVILWTFAPFLPSGMNSQSYRAFADLLEHRGTLEYIRRRLKHFEREMKSERDQGNGGSREQVAADSREENDERTAENRDTNKI